MAKTTTKISDTARAMLTLAATRPDRLVRPPQLPTAAARQVVRSLLNNGFAEEIPAPIEDAAFTWRTSDDAATLMLRATAAGLTTAGVTPALAETPQTIAAFMQEVIGFLAEEGCNATILEETEARTVVDDGFANGRPAARVAGDILAWLAEENERAEAETEAANTDATGADTADDEAVAREAAAVADALETAPMPPARATLREAAQAVLDAWADRANRDTDIIGALEAPMATLRSALLHGGQRTTTTGTRPPRAGTKQELVLAMLRRDQGASGPQIAEATGWAAHTVRGFLAGLKKKGIAVETLERVRQVGSGKEGAKGSYSIYKLAD